MVRIKLNEKLICPKRHRYNPQKDGLNFHAGCEHCYALWKIHLAAQHLDLLIKSFERGKEVYANRSTNSI